MPQTDLSLQELWAYRSPATPPADLAAFWSGTLAEAAAHPLGAEFTRIDSGLTGVETYDVTFAGFAGDPIRAWLHLPPGPLRPAGRLPAVVQFQGYNGGRGLPHEFVFWALAGYAHLVVDTRGQGSGWTVGATGDPAGSDPSQPGFLTRGVLDPATYYYRRVFIDAVRAIEAVRVHPAVDPDRIAVTGASQGGGMTIAVAGLSDGVVAVMPDVPFLCDFRRAADITCADPYAELARYLRMHRDRVDRVFATLAYFDGAVLGRMARVPALFSVALMDETCPPSTVFGAYHEYGGPKEIKVYEFNGHEGGDAYHKREQLAWLRARLG